MPWVRRIGEYAPNWSHRDRHVVVELIGVAILAYTFGDGVEEYTVGRPEIGRGARRSVVAVTRCRRPRVEPLVAVKGLTDQAGTDELSVVLDERPVRLVVERDLGCSGDRERVQDAAQDSEHEYCTDRCEHLGTHVS